MPALIIVGAIAVGAIAFAVVFNGLVSKRNEVDNAWAQIDVQLKRRHDLIPNLVETVKGYARHERELFERITSARASAMRAEGPKAQSEAENALTSTLRSLFAVAENYPKLQASQNFLALQLELSGTEDRIAAARQFYNDAVYLLNTRVQTLPGNLVAAFFSSFRARQYFSDPDAHARGPVDVRF